MQLSKGAEDAAAVLDSLRHLVRGLRATAHATEQKIGVTGAQLFVMRELRIEPNISVRRLSERTLTDPSSVSVVVARLVERGLVSSRRDPADARRNVLALTPKGARLLSRAPEPFQARLAMELRKLPPATLRRLSVDLAALVHATGADQGTPPMFFDDEPKGRASRG